MNTPNCLKCSFALAFGIFVYLLPSKTAFSQNYFFYHLDKKNGLHDGTIRAFAQDKFGYMWIGTMSGLYRYNSCGITSFLPEIGDSSSAPESMITGMVCNSVGDIWLGTARGIYKFSYDNGKFTLLPETERFYINEIKILNDQYVMGLTNKGPVLIDTYHFSFINIGETDQDNILQKGISDMVVYKQKIYFSSDQGLICYDPQKRKIIKVIRMSNDFPGITCIKSDNEGYLWANWEYRNGILYKINLETEEIETINIFEQTTHHLTDQIHYLFIDSKDRLWISTRLRGLILFNKTDHSFESFSHQTISIYSSIADNHTRKIYEDVNGNIWVGTEGHGVNYFNPDVPGFFLFVPEFQNNKTEPIWCRTVIIDSEGQTWLGTIDGIEILSPLGGAIAHFQNTTQTKPFLHSNSIRSMICDDKGDIWIGTSSGVNKYEKKTKEIIFYSEKDSLPPSFYWSIMQDSKKRIWFGSKSGLHFKDVNDPQIHSVARIPVLKRYADWGIRSLFEDKRKNIWIGLNGSGLLFYNPQLSSVRWFHRDPKNAKCLIGNTVTSITEDNEGYIWLSTSNGISRYDYENDQFNSYNHRNGLQAIKTSCLQVDSKNRVWIGTTAGLYVLQPDRKTFSIYNTENGLPNVEFNDQSSYRWAVNQFLYPTLGGYICFDPDKFIPDTNNVEFYLSNFKVLGESIQLNSAIEEVPKVNLASDENFFSIELSAVDYKNPNQAWYAYKLDGINKEWIYTQDRTIDFTDVPGGSYTFRYKATNDINRWDMPEKKLEIHINTVFYKRTFFKILVVIWFLLIIFYAVRFRYRKQAQILKLESKSQVLEKENAIAQYENLKQQLNPHLLFNTISSINNLIKTDPKVANEYLEKMSKIYRYILQHSDRSLVLLEDEITFVQNYISLQYLRFPKGLKISIEIEESVRKQKIVPVTFQNLIENAIKHNIIDSDKPLFVQIYNEENYVVIKNNLQKKSVVETSNKQGIHNLTLLYGYFSPNQIIIEEDPYFFTIKIPLL